MLSLNDSRLKTICHLTYTYSCDNGTVPTFQISKVIQETVQDDSQMLMSALSGTNSLIILCRTVLNIMYIVHLNRILN